MLYNYNSYRLIKESTDRESKIKKAEDKIKKFANIPKIYNWAIDKCINDRSTEGLQFSVWIANIIKERSIDALLDTIGKTYNIKISEFENLFKNGSDNKLDKLIKKEWTTLDSCIEGIIETLNDDINYILDWLKNPLRTELIKLSELTFDTAFKKSEEWHNSLKATGKITDESGEIFIEFEDGFYWIDLQTTYSKDEAEAMGHCGNTNDGDTLFSLRDKNKSPHVTVAYDSSDGAIYQMKGRNNKKPIDKYHPYIYRLLVDPELKPKYFGYEWNKDEDFNLSDFDKETFDKVYKYNSDLIYKSINYDSEMCRGLINKEYLDKEDVKEVMINSVDVSCKVFFQVIDLDLYTTDEFKNIFINSNINMDGFGELAWLKLYHRDIIDLNKLAEYFTEIKIENGIGNIYYDKDDLDHFMSYGVGNILFDEDWYESGDFRDMDSSDYMWKYLTKETKEEVIEKIINKIINYYVNREAKFENVKIEKNMIQWINDDFYFIYDNEKFNITDILDQNKADDLNDIYDNLTRAINYAQESADIDEYYKKAKKELSEILGDFTRDTLEIEIIGGKKKYIEVLKFDAVDLINKIDMDELEDLYRCNGEVDYEDEKYGRIKDLLDELLDKKAELNDDHGIYGKIDKNVLNDYVNNEL